MLDIRDDMLSRLENLEKIVRTAFPNGDADSHRKFHEALMETASWYKHLRRRILEKIIIGVSFFMAGGLAILLWEAFKQQVIK